MSDARHFELLVECEQCGRYSHTSLVLYRLNEDRRLRFCSVACKMRWMDTHPSDRGDLDPRVAALWD